MKRRFTSSTLGTLAVVLTAAFVVGGTRYRAEDARRRAKETSETFLLPPAAQLKRASLGYRAALADYLWAHVLVTQGLRLGERRRFETITSYLETITELDPDFREPYLLADALTTMQAKAADADDIRAVRRLLEKGAKRFPNDPEVWLALGQFVVYVAPGAYLKDPEEQSRWRLEGSAYLERAAALGSHDPSVAWRAIGGARPLFQAGERAATIRFYERALAVTTDDELRRDLEGRLAGLLGQREIDLRRGRRQRFEKVWRETYPSWSLTGVLIGGPPFDPFACAGHSAAPASESIECATTWPEWNRIVDDELAVAGPVSSSPPPAP